MILMIATEEAGDHILSSDTIFYQTWMTFISGKDFLVETVKHFYVFLLLPANSYANARTRLVTDLLFRKCSRGVEGKI